MRQLWFDNISRFCRVMSFVNVSFAYLNNVSTSSSFWTSFLWHIYDSWSCTFWSKEQFNKRFVALHASLSTFNVIYDIILPCFTNAIPFHCIFKKFNFTPPHTHTHSHTHTHTHTCLTYIKKPIEIGLRNIYYSWSCFTWLKEYS